MGGYSMIALINPKTASNVGNALRAAHAYSSAGVLVEGERGAKTLRGLPTNVSRAERHIPLTPVVDIFDARPFDCEVVVVDLIAGATPLPDFKHPRSALYVFGPEDGTLGYRHTARAQHVVQIPTSICMNLAATVNVVLYDRIAKQQRQGSSGVERQTENLGVVGSIPSLATIEATQ